MTADKMMYKLGFEKLDDYTHENELMYECVKGYEYWTVHFFKVANSMNYDVSHCVWVKSNKDGDTNGDWKQVDSFVPAELHRAIHKVFLENKWL